MWAGCWSSLRVTGHVGRDAADVHIYCIIHVHAFLNGVMQGTRNRSGREKGWRIGNSNPALYAAFPCPDLSCSCGEISGSK